QPERAFALLEAQTRRHFLRSATGGLGAMFLGTLVAPLALPGKEAAEGPARIDIRHDPRSPLGVLPPQFAPRAKRVIYLHMAGAARPPVLVGPQPQLTRFPAPHRPPSLLT